MGSPVMERAQGLKGQRRLWLPGAAIKRNWRYFGAILLYLAAIVAANVAVALWGPAVSVLNAFLFIGLDLSCRDVLHERWAAGSRASLWGKMALLIGAGGLLSVWVNQAAGPIAAASALAFLAAGGVDAGVYHALRQRGYLWRANGSNVAGAAVDSLVFPWLAFGGWLWPIVAGQFLAKVVGGLGWSLVLRGEGERRPTAGRE